jgi:hypothetical protein
MKRRLLECQSDVISSTKVLPYQVVIMGGQISAPALYTLHCCSTTDTFIRSRMSESATYRYNKRKDFATRRTSRDFNIPLLEHKRTNLVTWEVDWCATYEVKSTAKEVDETFWFSGETAAPFRVDAMRIVLSRYTQNSAMSFGIHWSKHFQQVTCWYA